MARKKIQVEQDTSDAYKVVRLGDLEHGELFVDAKVYRAGLTHLRRVIRLESYISEPGARKTVSQDVARGTFAWDYDDTRVIRAKTTNVLKWDIVKAREESA